MERFAFDGVDLPALYDELDHSVYRTTVERRANWFDRLFLGAAEDAVQQFSVAGDSVEATLNPNYARITGTESRLTEYDIALVDTIRDHYPQDIDDLRQNLEQYGPASTVY